MLLRLFFSLGDLSRNSPGIDVRVAKMAVGRTIEGVGVGIRVSGDRFEAVELWEEVDVVTTR